MNPPLFVPRAGAGNFISNSAGSQEHMGQPPGDLGQTKEAVPGSSDFAV